jgi:DNA-binding NtrC family response regulator
MKFGLSRIEGNLATKDVAHGHDLPILVIEDEDSVQSFLNAALRRHGYATVIASSASEALQFLKERDFCGVISDIRIPGQISVGELHAWIGSNRPQLLSRMVFMTGDVSGEEASQVIGKTGAPCLEKPFRLDDLMAALTKVLEN